MEQVNGGGWEAAVCSTVLTGATLPRAIGFSFLGPPGWVASLAITIGTAVATGFICDV